MAVIKIREFLVNLLLDIDPELYGPSVTTDKKVEKVIIVQCIDAIYLTMVARLIYCKHCLKSLKRTRLQINTYDPCVANLLVNDK